MGIAVFGVAGVLFVALPSGAGAQEAPVADGSLAPVVELICQLTGLLCPPPPAPPPAPSAPNPVSAPAPAPAPALRPSATAPTRPASTAALSPTPTTGAPSSPSTSVAAPSPSPDPATTGAPTRTVAASPPRPEPVRSTETALVLTEPADLDVSAGTVAAAAGISLTGLILIGFPAELFNKTLQQNYGRLARLFPWIRPGHGGDGHIGRPLLHVGALAFSCAMAGAIGTLQKVREWDWTLAARTALAIAVGFLITTVVFEVAGAVAGARMGLPRRRFRTYAGALPIVAVFVGISTVGNLQPAYLYGHLAGSRWEDEQPSPRGRALQIVAAAAGLFTVAVAAWALRAVVTAPLLDDVLAAVALVGLNRLVFALVPATFLDGHGIFRFRRGLWAAVYTPVLATFILLVLVPAARRDAEQVLAASATLFVVFAAISVGCWAWFRRTARTQEAFA